MSNYRANNRLEKSKNRIPKPIIPSELKRKGVSPVTQEGITALRERANERIVFSFQLLNRSHQAFNLGGKNVDWFLGFIDSLKDLSILTRQQLKNELSKYYRSHGHDFTQLKYSYEDEGIDEEFIAQAEVLQYSLGKSKGRIHGLLLGNRFYVIWIDANHNLYPSDKHGGEKIYSYPQSDYEKMEQKLQSIQFERDEALQREQDLTNFFENECSNCDKVKAI